MHFAEFLRCSSNFRPLPTWLDSGDHFSPSGHFSPSIMSSKIFLSRGSTPDAVPGGDEDHAMNGGAAAAAAADVAPDAAADSTSTPAKQSAKAGKKKKTKTTPVKEAAVLADLASSASGKSPDRQQQHQLPMFLSSKSINITCAVFCGTYFFRPHLERLEYGRSTHTHIFSTLHPRPNRDVSHDIPM